MTRAALRALFIAALIPSLALARVDDAAAKSGNTLVLAQAPKRKTPDAGAAKKKASDADAVKKKAPDGAGGKPKAPDAEAAKKKAPDDEDADGGAAPKKKAPGGDAAAPKTAPAAAGAAEGEASLDDLDEGPAGVRAETPATVTAVHPERPWYILKLTTVLPIKTAKGDVVALRLLPDGAWLSGVVRRAGKGDLAVGLEKMAKGLTPGAKVAVLDRESLARLPEEGIVTGKIVKRRKKKKEIDVEIALPGEYAAGDEHEVRFLPSGVVTRLVVAKAQGTRLTFALGTLAAQVVEDRSVIFLDVAPPPADPTKGAPARGVAPTPRGHPWSVPSGSAVSALTATRVDLSVSSVMAKRSFGGDGEFKAGGVTFGVKPWLAFGPGRGGLSLLVESGTRTVTGDGGYEAKDALLLASLDALYVIAKGFSLGVAVRYETESSTEEGFESKLVHTELGPRLGYVGDTGSLVLSYFPKSKAKAEIKLEERTISTDGELASRLDLALVQRLGATLVLIGTLGYDFDDVVRDDREKLTAAEAASFTLGPELTSGAWRFDFGLLRNRSTFGDARPSGEPPRTGGYAGVSRAFGAVEAKLQIEGGSGAVERASPEPEGEPELVKGQDTGALLRFGIVP